MDNSIPPFYVGQEVVAIRDHSERDFIKGDEFKVTSIRKVCCSWMITVHLPSDGRLGECVKCGLVFNVGLEANYDSTSFAPKVEISAFISMKELADKQLELISAN